MSMAAQIRSVCQVAYWHFGGIATIRKNTSACKTIIYTLVMSRLDYGSAMVYRLPETQLRKLQMVQNSADYWNPQTRSHNTSFLQFTLVASSSANRIQASITRVSRCASSLPSVSVVASESTLTQPNTDIRRSTSIDYTAVPSRTVRSSGLFCSRADTVERPAPPPPAIRQANPVAAFKSLLKTQIFRVAFRTLC